jgi:mevalonate kinase
MSAQGTGHGKIILLGEHSVVYGRPALAAAIAQGCHARAERAERAERPLESTLTVEPWGVRVVAQREEEEPERELLRRAFAVICEQYGANLSVSATMEIPGGAGLGGSAALSVAVIRACDAAVGVSHTVDEIIELSLAWERVFHGNPSGVDSAMAALGGVAVYRKGQPLAPHPIGAAFSFVVAHSGEHGSTKQMVASVARQHARDPQKADQVFDAIGAIVENGMKAIERGERENFGQLMDLNQKLLSSLLLSTSALEEMCKSARDAGALGAKLTGGGGGGCMIALGRDRAHAEELVQVLGGRGHKPFVVEVM